MRTSGPARARSRTCARLQYVCVCARARSLAESSRDPTAAARDREKSTAPVCVRARRCVPGSCVRACAFCIHTYSNIYARTCVRMSAPRRRSVLAGCCSLAAAGRSLPYRGCRRRRHRRPVVVVVVAVIGPRVCLRAFVSPFTRSAVVRARIASCVCVRSSAVVASRRRQCALPSCPVPSRVRYVAHAIRGRNRDKTIFCPFPFFFLPKLTLQSPPVAESWVNIVFGFVPRRLGTARHSAKRVHSVAVTCSP